jgi:putative sugar O-methyltransferase
MCRKFIMYSDFIQHSLDSFHEYVANNLPVCRNHRAARVSPFWAELFSNRKNFPDTQDFLAFRRGDFLYGIGDTKPSSTAQKRQEFANVCKSMELFTPSTFIESLREPFLGAPLVFPYGRNSLSTSYVLNAGTTWRIKELLRQHGPQGRALHVCEIGAGWGACASQLHQVCDVASYTIIDLPENLCLSSTYLRTTLTGRQPHFLDCTPGATVQPVQAALYFGLPAAIDNLPGPYDLIINTLSFQEMDQETVDAYFSWAAKVLAPDGVIVSFNAHDKAGILRPSQYLTDGLALVHMAPFRRVPAGYFNTIPYEMVFRRSDGPQQAGQIAAVDALGEMIQLGLDGQLAPLAEAAVGARQSPSQEDTPPFTALQDFFYAETETQRLTTLQTLLSVFPGAISEYLAGTYHFARNDFGRARPHLESALADSLDGFAEIRAHVLLAAMGSRKGANKNRRIAETLRLLEPKAGGLLTEIEMILERQAVSALQDHIARVLDCTVETPLTVRAFLGKIRRALVKR